MSERREETVGTKQASGGKPAVTNNERTVVSVPEVKLPVRRDLTEQEMWDQLTRANDLRSSEDQVLWSIFGTFWAANAILMVALFTTGALPSSPAVGITVSAVGALLSGIWHKIQKRALGHLGRYEELSRKLEDRLGFETKYATSGTLNTEDYQEFVAKEKPSARKLMLGCSLVGTWAWLGAFVYFVVQSVLTQVRAGG